MVKKGLFVFVLSLILLTSFVCAYQTEIRVKGVPYYDVKINVMNDNPAFGSTVVERLRGELNKNGDALFVLDSEVPEFYFKAYLYDLGEDIALYEVLNNSGKNYLAEDPVYLQLIPASKSVPTTPVSDILTWDDALNINISELNLSGVVDAVVNLVTNNSQNESDNNSVVIELDENETGEVTEILEAVESSDDAETLQPVTGRAVSDIFTSSVFYYVIGSILAILVVVLVVYFVVKRKKKKKSNFEIGEIVEDSSQPKIVVRKLSEVRKEQMEKRKENMKSSELVEAERKLVEAQKLLMKLKGEKEQAQNQGDKPQDIGTEIKEDSEDTL